jgi:hypothetical protein
LKHTINQIIESKHRKIRKLVTKWNMADELENVGKYLEYTYYISMTIHQIKWLKRLLKLQNFWEKLFKDLKK